VGKSVKAQQKEESGLFHHHIEKPHKTIHKPMKANHVMVHGFCSIEKTPLIICQTDLNRHIS
jgi:hypothetical protein